MSVTELYLNESVRSSKLVTPIFMSYFNTMRGKMSYVALFPAYLRLYSFSKFMDVVLSWTEKDVREREL